MRQIDFENIELSLYAKFVLHCIAVFRFDRIYLKSTINLLWKLEFIKRYNITKHGNWFKRTPQGRMYLRVKRKAFIRFAIPTIISIIALLASYDILWIKPLSELLQGLGTILKSIMESLDAFREMIF